MANTIGILVPTAKPKVKGIPVNPRFHNLDGKVVGFLWNEKPNGDVLLRRIREHISQKYKLAGTDWAQSGAREFVEELTAPALDQVTASADTVVVAIGD